MPSPLPYQPDVEVIPADEPADIERAVTALDQILHFSDTALDPNGPNVHLKAHGCAAAELRVPPNLPVELAQGLFARERTFSAVVRFSNSAPIVQPDAVPDGRGLAIKVLDVEGPLLASDNQDRPAQDFILVDHPVFFARDVKDLRQIEQGLAAAKNLQPIEAGKAFAGGQWNPLRWHWHAALTALQTAARLPTHPASLTYYSMSPYRYGDYVAKYRVKPASILPSALIDRLTQLVTDADALRRMLEETLRAQALEFEFQVQLRTSAERMPVEDATVEWPESESPYRTVARLVIPPQEISADEQPQLCEQLEFNVWHALEAHRPLGGINRLRRVVYPLAAATRRRRVGSRK